MQPREIKFRAWDVKLRKFGWCNPSVERLSLLNSEGNYVLYGGRDFVFTQFTGLKDSRGRDIYEGDILRKLHCKNGVVEFSGASFCNKVNTPKGYRWYLLNSEDCELSEVIGNIYENPELLENNDAA